MKKVSLRIEDEILEVLITLCGTDNVSEVVRIAIMFYLQNNDVSEKVNTLFPYIGKKPPRIGREVAEAFAQSGCNIFVDLFCGSLAILCYLAWETKVVVNDINGNLTNLYKIIRDRPSAFIREVMQLPYSEVVFKQFGKDLKSGTIMTDMEWAVAYYYVSFGAYRGRMDNPMMRISANVDSNMSMAYQKNMKWILQLSRRLQKVEILNRDFRDVLKQYNSRDIFVYADCPYLGTEDYYENVFTPKDHEFSKGIENRVSNMEVYLETYIKLLQRVIETGIEEGEVHTNLKLFLASAEQLKGQMKGFSDQIREYNAAFIEEMEAADDFLY